MTKLIQISIVLIFLIPFNNSTNNAPPPLVAPVIFSKKEAHCLALNIYHESRNQSKLGQLAVAAVTLNRTTNSICDAVYKTKIHYKSKKKVAMFSWTITSKANKLINQKQYDKIYVLVEQILRNEVELPISKAVTLYHAKHVTPKWSRSKQVKRITQIGDHVFYQEL
ncbi:MAG: hypothetical protein HC836_10610 [Richelia sp. RM2_1_2]|nr:hypothetical protein [Richelia sp. RM2_1_2]